jgi:hypothetical protein
MKPISLTRDQLEDLRNELISINSWDKSYENSITYNSSKPRLGRQDANGYER